MTDPLLERAGQVGLVKKAGLVNGVEDGDTLPQEGSCPLGALDLPNVGLRETGNMQETMPDCAW
jgi:hypothetical protein